MKMLKLFVSDLGVLRGAIALAFALDPTLIHPR